MGVKSVTFMKYAPGEKPHILPLSTYTDVWYMQHPPAANITLYIKLSFFVHEL